MLKKIREAMRAEDYRFSIELALSLRWKNEVRSDGAVLVRVSDRREVQESRVLTIEWKARHIHPWDRARNPSDEEQLKLFHSQCFSDAESIIIRLFDLLPEINSVRFSVIRPDRKELLLAGAVERSALEWVAGGAASRWKLRQMGVNICNIAT